MSSIAAFFLFSAILLSTATQLRFGVFGLGEVCGAIGILCVLVSTQTVPAVVTRYLCGIGIIALGVTLGWLVSIVFLDGDVRALDLWAMLYAQVTACALLLLSFRISRPGTVVLPALVAFPILQMLLLVASFLGWIGMPVWFGGEEDAEAGIPFVSRFMGWAINPNQLGISLSALPFWLIVFYMAATRAIVRLAIAAALAAGLACGVFVNSNTVFLAWMVGGLIVFSRGAWRGIRKVPLILPAVAAALLGAVVLATSLLPGLIEKGDDADLNGRLPIWMMSLENWARSPLFGLGPGPHATDGSGGVTAESHMLVLDLLTQGGVMATAAMFYLFWLSLRAAISSGNAAVLAAAVAICMESLAHNTQRHPMFWVYLVLPLIFLRRSPRPQEEPSAPAR